MQFAEITMAVPYLAGHMYMYHVTTNAATVFWPLRDRETASIPVAAVLTIIADAVPSSNIDPGI